LIVRGIDVLDVYRGRMSLRRLRVLIEHLPPESATKTAMRNAAPADIAAKSSEGARPDLGRWSNLEMLTAALLDAVRANTSVLVAANGGTPLDLTPTPRPGIPPTKSTGRRRLTDEQRRAIDPRLRTEPREA
jgi:antitoxin (DNA-binding transcriptional repressor) of toxin-antitoxin stability system